jgi:hypothetical protein
MTAAEQAARFQTGPTWQGRGKSGLSQQQAETFTDYPLFWLGESFAGYNLQGIVRAKYDPPAGIPPQFAHGEDVVAFFYGTCTPESSDPELNRCAVPAQVMTRPICAVRPEQILPTLRASGPAQTVRGGAQLHQGLEGHAMLWTGKVSVQVITMADPTLVTQGIQQARSVGAGQAGMPAIQAGQSLPPPDFSSCPPVTMPPFPPPLRTPTP